MPRSTTNKSATPSIMLDGERPRLPALAGGEIIAIEIKSDGDMAIVCVANSYATIDRALGPNALLAPEHRSLLVDTLVRDIAEANGVLVSDSDGLFVRTPMFPFDGTIPETAKIAATQVESAFAQAYHFAWSLPIPESLQTVGDMNDALRKHDSREDTLPDHLCAALGSALVFNMPYGTLVNVETLYFYDAPLLYVVRSRAPHGIRQELACSVQDFAEDGVSETTGRTYFKDRILLAAITDEDVSDIKANRLTIRGAVRKSPRIQYADIIETRADGYWPEYVRRLNVVAFDAIPEADLPGEVFLHPPPQQATL